MPDQPHRVRLSRANGWRMPPNTVKVDRSTRYGNPWSCHQPYGCPHSPAYDHGFEADGSPTMSCCVDTYAEWVRQGIAGEESHLIGKGGGLLAHFMAKNGNKERTRLVEGLPKLRGKNLACRCPLDRPCHADALLAAANQPLTCEASDG